MAVDLPPSLAGKRIAVVGLGVEGAATARWLLDRGADVEVRDQRPAAELSDVLKPLGNVPTACGPEYLDGLEAYEVVFRTPVLPTTHEALEHARSNGTLVTSHTRLFMELCPAPIVGVSGTKGKGTTAGLIHAMLEAGGKQAFLGGNIGQPPLEFLDEVNADSVVVLELSSFQLEDVDRSPQVAVVTNLTADHLDRHASLEEYHAAKRGLVMHQSADDLAILNADDRGSKAIAEYAGGRVEWFSTKRPVDPGAFTQAGDIVLKTPSVNGTICSVDDVPVPGEHNRANVLAACVAAAAFDVPNEAMAKAIKAFQGLPYHLEAIGEHGGVAFFNDSYATNPTATIPAIESFDRPLVLIVGGAEKQADFSELAKVIAERNVRALVTIPPEGERIAAAAKEAGSDAEVLPAAAKEEIVGLAVQAAKPGDVVLFSPAAASFGWFTDYQDRGKFFTDAVNALK